MNSTGSPPKTCGDLRYATKGERRYSRSEARLWRVEPCSAASRQAGSHPLWVLLAGGFLKHSARYEEAKRVRDGIRTRDPRNHNPMLYPTELHSPLQPIILHSLSIICKVRCLKGNLSVFACLGEASRSRVAASVVLAMAE